MPMRWGPGPVFVYESITAARRWQHYALRALSVLALLESRPDSEIRTLLSICNELDLLQPRLARGGRGLLGRGESANLANGVVLLGGGGLGPGQLGVAEPLEVLPRQQPVPVLV